jgi:hypothetical protein
MLHKNIAMIGIYLLSSKSGNVTIRTIPERDIEKDDLSGFVARQVTQLEGPDGFVARAPAILDTE